MAGFDPAELALLAPELWLAASGLVLLVLSTIGRGLSHRLAAGWSAVSVAVAALLVLRVGGLDGARTILAGMFVIDGYGLSFKLVLLFSLLAVVGLSLRFLARGGYRAGEYYALLLLAGMAMLLMASGTSLLSIWISLETMALASYVLVGYFRNERKSTEAALKYFVLGALSSGVLLYGISLLYGATGTLELTALASRLGAVGTSPFVLVGWVLVAAGLLFKVAAAPFHVWVPDVYVGAPTPVTVFLAAGSKLASFAILVRIFGQGLVALPWQTGLAVVAAASMIWGNLAALTQVEVKRMLAYSSVAHAGYALVGLVAGGANGAGAVLFYLIAYAFVVLGAFGVVLLLEKGPYASQTYGDYAGLARRQPGLAAAMTLFLLALVGIPPTGGFVGKLYVFAAAVERGWTWLAVIGVLTSAISLYYYFGLAAQMYLREPEAESAARERPSRPALAVVAASAVGVLVLGLLPGALLQLCQKIAPVLP